MARVPNDPRSLLERLLEDPDAHRPATPTERVTALQRSIRRSIADLAMTRTDQAMALRDSGLDDIPVSRLPARPDTPSAAPAIKQMCETIEQQLARWEPRLKSPRAEATWDATRRELGFKISGRAKTQAVDAGVFVLYVTVRSGRLHAPEFTMDALPRPI